MSDQARAAAAPLEGQVRATEEVRADIGGRSALPGRWSILSLLFAAQLVNYLDRSALSVALPFIVKDYHLTQVEQGVVLSAFFVGYALFNVIGGLLADRFGSRNVLALAMVAWSSFCALTAVTVGVVTLAIARALFGVGEGPVSTTMNKSISEWFPQRERARALGIVQAGGPLGGALAAPVIGFLSLAFGWRVSFLIIGAIGFLWVAAWLWATRARHDVVVPAEAKTARAAGGQLIESLSRKGVLPLGISLMCYNYVLFFFLTWFPSYLVDARGLSLAEMSVVAMLPWLGGVGGYLAGGVFIDWLSIRIGNAMLARKRVLVGSLSVSALAVLAVGFAATTTVAIALMAVAVAFLMIGGPSYWALIQDLAPPEQVGTAGGVMHGLGNISGIVAPILTAAIIAAVGSWTSTFVVAGALGLLGAAVIAVYVRS